MTKLIPLLLMLFAGCNFSADSAPGADNTCAEQGDCMGGICDDGVCVQGSVAPFFATLQVTRDPNDVNSAVPEGWTVDAEMIDGSTTLDVNLPTMLRVLGKVRWQGEQVPAKLTFTRLEQSANLAAPASVEVFSGGGELRGDQPSQNSDYAVRLVRDANYELIVEPTSDAIGEGAAISVLPPVRLPSLPVTPGDADFQELDITYPASLSDPCGPEQRTLCTLSGQIVTNAAEEGLVAQSGLFVRAVENATDRVVSSIVTTNAEGEFAIRIGAGVGEYSIRFNSGTDGALFPVVTVPVSEPPIVIELPEPSPVTFVGSVKGPDGLPVLGATVQFLTEEALGSGTFVGELSVIAETRGNGTFTAELLPAGEYQVLITPPQNPTRPMGVLFEEDIGVFEDEVEREFELPSQVNFSGTVSSQEGNPFVGAAVSARARRSVDSLFAATNRSRDATTNAGGAFEVNLDVGLYDLLVRPPVEAGFAWLVEPDTVFEEDDVRNWKYDIPVSIDGTVRDFESAPAVGATVRLFVEVGGPNGTRALQVAEATTDDQGQYRLLVNPQ